MDIKRYSWSFNEDTEVWGSGTFDTIADCMEDAEKERDLMADDCIEPPNAVFIGENIPFEPYVDAEDVLETLEEQAGERCGEVGYDWDAGDPKKTHELEELSNTLTTAVREWLCKYGYEPGIYSIENITKHPLPPYVKLSGAYKRLHAGLDFANGPDMTSNYFPRKENQ
ncbi:hypothetical protein SDC9_94450 [bioreactor metagenome]|uniref:Uncharacterized protein n=1 Tax=bioreactor metagenome TaxID=1076179 RepID=A0A645A479_9ZZZZ